MYSLRKPLTISAFILEYDFASVKCYANKLYCFV